MKILLCGTEDDCHETAEKIQLQIPDAEICFCEDEDSLLYKLKQNAFDMVIVLLDGADGMEAVITLRRQQPEAKVIWFSDDIGFAAQSYRLNTAYFHEKPATSQVISMAFASCGLVVAEKN